MIIECCTLVVINRLASAIDDKVSRLWNKAYIGSGHIGSKPLLRIGV